MPVTSAPARGLRIAELAELVGVSTDTVRYYERAGLLPPPPRTPSGYRAYQPTAVDRLRFIQGAQRLGLRLRDIGDLLSIRDTGVCPCEPAEQLLRRRLDEVDAEMLASALCATRWWPWSSNCPPGHARRQRQAPGAHLRKGGERQ